MLPEKGDRLPQGIEARRGIGLIGAPVDGGRVGRNEVRVSKKRKTPSSIGVAQPGLRMGDGPDFRALTDAGSSRGTRERAWRDSNPRPAV